MIRYGIIGAGWRAEFYLRIAELCPTLFQISGIYIRNPEKREAFSAKYHVPIMDTLEKLLKSNFDFLVSCVNKANIFPMIKKVASQHIPMLSETPIFASPDEIDPDWRVQVAEQFHFQPQYVSIKKVIDLGLLGEITQLKLSTCHDYHAASLIRFFLETDYEKPSVQSFTLDDRVMKYDARTGYQEPYEVQTKEKISILTFQNKTAIYDFCSEQYFSLIRMPHLTIRGTRGEICNNTCTYIQDGIPHSFQLERNFFGINGNLDGFCLYNITGNGEVLYENPFPYARLSDEELAIATCLKKMDTYLKTGEPFYTLVSAAFDADLLTEATQ